MIPPRAPEQIKASLMALDEYEMAILRNSRDGLDDPDAEDRALFKIMEARSRLRASLAGYAKAKAEEGQIGVRIPLNMLTRQQKRWLKNRALAAQAKDGET